MYTSTVLDVNQRIFGRWQKIPLLTLIHIVGIPYVGPPADLAIDSTNVLNIFYLFFTTIVVIPNINYHYRLSYFY